MIIFRQIFVQPLVTDHTKFLGYAASSTIWPGLNSCWNQITSDNDGKWGSLDAIYNYAIQQGLQYEHH